MFPPLSRLAAVVSIGCILMGFGGCKSHNARIIDSENVMAQTEGWGLRKLDPKDYPDMRAAWDEMGRDKAGLLAAIERSQSFLRKPSTARFYPSHNPGDTITREQVFATLVDVKKLIGRNITADQFQQEILSRYDVYTSVGYNNKGDVWYTGYYTPIYKGSMTPDAVYKYPVYRRPADLQTDPLTGEVLGGTYATRRELAGSGKLRGLELCYFAKPIEPFIIQVQGSAQVVLQDAAHRGQTIYLGYAGSNGREHRGLGSELVNDKKIDKKHLSLPAVLAYFDEHPNELDEYVMRDDRFTFMKFYDATGWPSGSLGEIVTPHRSLATDKNIFPRASITMIDVPKPVLGGETTQYQGFVLDQDTGGGIRMAGRADIYMGIGPSAGDLAGREFAQGKLYYFFVKPELIQAGDVAELRKPTAAKGPTAPPKTTTPPLVPAKGGTGPGKTTPTKGGDEMFPGAVRK